MGCSRALGLRASPRLSSQRPRPALHLRAPLPEAVQLQGPLPALSGPQQRAVCWPRCLAARGASVLVCTGSCHAPGGPGFGRSSPGWGAVGAGHTRRGCRSVAEEGTGWGDRAGPSLQAGPWRPEYPAEGEREAGQALGARHTAPAPLTATFARPPRWGLVQDWRPLTHTCQT